MKDYVIILVGIVIALLIVGGAVGFTSMKDDSDNSNSTISPIQESNNTTQTVKNATLENKTDAGDSDIVSETIEYNAQNGGGYFREVTYKDGGFRQFDLETGELIGSSYDSDQHKLPSLE